MAEILSGKLMSEQLTLEQAERGKELRKQGIVPGLAVILAGENPRIVRDKLNSYLPAEHKAKGAAKGAEAQNATEEAGA